MIMTPASSARTVRRPEATRQIRESAGPALKTVRKERISTENNEKKEREREGEREREESRGERGEANRMGGDFMDGRERASEG